MDKNKAPPNTVSTFALADLASRRKSWVLLFGEAPGMTPPRLFGLAILIFVPLSLFLDSPVVTAVTVAYVLTMTNYLVGKQEEELLALRFMLDCDDTVFEVIQRSLRRHSKLALNLSWVVGALAMLAMNRNASSMVAFRQGEMPTPATLWSWIIALFYWIAFFQMLLITLTNSRLFARIGGELTNIDLLDTSGLVPFARVGIRNILLFVGGYALLPLIYFDDNDYMLELVVSLSIVVPISLALLVMPMNPIRKRISREKDLELGRIQQAMHGDRSALTKSPISRDAGHIGFTGLVLYRQMINEINEWPMDYPVFMRLGLYFVIPLLTWFGAAIVERLVAILI